MHDYPSLFRLRRHFDSTRVENVAGEVENQLAALGVEIEDRDLDALRGERTRGGGAEARGAAGNDGGYGGIEFHADILSLI